MTGKTPLMIAASRGYVPLVRLLVARGVDIHARSAPAPRHPGGQTALMFAVQWGWVDTVKELLAAGASPHAVDDLGRSACSMATQTKMAEMGSVLREACNAK